MPPGSPVPGAAPPMPGVLEMVKGALGWADLAALVLCALALAFAVVWAMRRGWVRGPARLLDGVARIEELGWRWRFHKAAERARRMAEAEVRLAEAQARVAEAEARAAEHRR